MIEEVKRLKPLDNTLRQLYVLSGNSCAFTGCSNLIVDSYGNFIGQVCHIKAASEGGERFDSEMTNEGRRNFDNLILFCYEHHQVTNDILKYPVETMYKIKKKHEEKIRNSFLSPSFNSIDKLAGSIKRLLVQNFQVWKSYGPESDEAKANPISNLAEVWNLRKIDTIIPNNIKILNMIETNLDLINIKELEIYYKFIEHAKGFEENCYGRVEGVQRFPVEFEEVVDKYVV